MLGDSQVSLPNEWPSSSQHPTADTARRGAVKGRYRKFAESGDVLAGVASALIFRHRAGCPPRCDTFIVATVSLLFRSTAVAFRRASYSMAISRTTRMKPKQWRGQRSMRWRLMSRPSGRLSRAGSVPSPSSCARWHDCSIRLWARGTKSRYIKPCLIDGSEHRVHRMCTTHQTFNVQHSERSSDAQ